MKREEALKDYREEVRIAEDLVGKRYASVPLTYEQRRQTTLFIAYVFYRDIEYYKVFSLIKARGEEDVMIEEKKILEYVGIQGFDELIDEEKCFDVLDAYMQRDFADFIPPPKKPSPQMLELEEKVTKLIEQYTAEVVELRKEFAQAITSH